MGSFSEHVCLQMVQKMAINCTAMVTSLPVTCVSNITVSKYTSGSAMAEGPRDALVSRNSATTKYPYRMALFA